MTWRVFIMAIKNSKMTKDTSWQIITKLFVAAGSKNEISEAAAKSWIAEEGSKSHRECKSSRYFPDGKVEYEGVFHFFKNRPSDKIKNLQKQFREEIPDDSASPIDLETEDLDVFCWSLVNQFLDLHEFQRIDYTVLEDKSIRASHSLNSQKTEDGSEVSDHKCDVEQLKKDTPPSEVSVSSEISASELSLNSDKDIPHEEMKALFEEEYSIKRLFLPHHNNNCCYYCTYWVGDKKTFGAYTTATYGVCKKYNRPKQLSTDLACKDYQKRPKLLGEW